MKIFAVGMNYAAHCRELHPDKPLPTEPVIFLKPDSALLKDSNPFFLPNFSERIEYETELVVRINRLGKCIPERFASRYYDAATVGIDLTARDLQQKLAEAGNPWEISKGFDGAAVIGDFVSVEQLRDIRQQSFRLDIDGKTVQEGNTSDMIFGVNRIISYISHFFTLKMGDLLYTGTPAGVGPVHIGQHLEGFLGDKKVLNFYVR
ncbi:FAH family protein [Bacteroidetes bacterium oral taxon 272 str. F0290]|uniref:fumarylacetoacetate hydrolase family protein n=1 Tax=Phocaeicola abscessus TaxID=555313 RepID=UPI0003860EC4|nr:fumarylacetoacetate hydrolase family protein [Phocaeicola abscessus]EPT32895.1 FAH family protein [Bacteroidetes bacterium oral taxon 272 str. F0290]